jgi:short-subunit dehydrogenase
MDKLRPGIWVTGASSGIGREAVKEFARIGCNVYASARRITELDRLKKEVQKEKLDLEVFPCNIASAANVDQIIKKITAEGHIDCLINNAGITSYKDAEENSIQEITDIINTNLLGAVYCIKYCLPGMIKRKSGVIINILSTAVKHSFTGSTAYTASKMGLFGYTNVLREEVRKYNIRVVNVIPGATETPMWSQEVRKEKAERMMAPDEVARVLVSIFLQKGNLVTEEITIRPISGNI